jgi:hypothetical protein
VGGSSNTGAIVGGAVGGGVAILTAIVAIFYIQQRSRERSAVSSGVGAFQSDGGTPVSPSFPVAMKFYVRVFVLRASLVFPHVPLSSHFRTPRTRMTRLRSRGTNLKVIRTRRTPLLISEVIQAPWPIRSRRSHKTGDITATATPLSDLARRGHRIWDWFF